MNQLQLTKKELKLIGFKKYKTKGDKRNPQRISFKINTTNGYFYYTPELCVWYHKTFIGDKSNHIHLNIQKKPELFLLLSCFNAEINKIDLKSNKQKP